MLNRLLEEQSIRAQVDWNRHAVTLQRKGQSTQLTTSASPTENRTTPARAAGVPKTHSAARIQPNQWRRQLLNLRPCNDKIGADTDSGETAASHRTTDRTCNSGQNRTAPAGTTLREMLMKWAQDTRCESGASPHWTVIWPVAVTDYRLDAPLTFRGSFETMLGQMFDLYRTAQKPLYAEASRMQCVVSVTDTPAGR